jgi:pimeloyl-ACP methyl ester carboxylesterase
MVSVALAEWPMPWITSRDGYRLAYSTEGAGPPLLLHLGAGGDASLWEAAGYLEPLAEHYECILFDHRGHGASDRPEGAEANHIDRYADDVRVLLDELGIARAAFWGYSNGLSVGIRVASNAPDRLWALIGTGTTFYEPDDTPEAIRQFMQNRPIVPVEQRWDRLIARFETQEPDPIPEWMKERIRSTHRSQADGWTEASADWEWSDWQALTHLDLPTLLITGEHEDPTDDMGKAAEAMSHGRRLRLEGQGHINAFLRSDLVLPTVLEFLAENHPY